MRTPKLVLSLLLLAGCATTPGIKVVHDQVPVITTKACINTADIPKEPSGLGQAPDDIEKALATALAKVSEWSRYGEKADIALRGCST